MWFSRLRNRRSDDTEITEAVTALAEAEQSLQVAVSRDREINKVVANLRYHREVNHFAERFKEALREA